MCVLSEGRGDYDGDVMEAFWQPTLVQKFRPADKEFADEPAELAGRLKVGTESVQEFEKRMMGASTETRIFELQRYLLGALHNPDLVGVYSNMWEDAVFMHGYDSKEAMLLANTYVIVFYNSQYSFASCLTTVA